MNERMRDLERKRRNWVDATRENGFREGIADLLAHQYSRKTHFIFELLQNAEDAEATTVSFELAEDRLTFSHNGKRLFSDDNVESITSIGRSTKQEDFTQIGKHGIGFKAVFAYTHAPRIHSGDKHFEILDVVLPRFFHPNDVPSDIQSGETRIILPFDSEALPDEHRFRELIPSKTALPAISEALENLSIRTLLFLQNIEELRWRLPDGKTRTYLRETDCSRERFNLRNVTVKDGEMIETWAVFTTIIDVADDGDTHECTVEVGYHIREGRVVPATNTELVVYFPTEKKTELGFLIHGPFKTTKARDNIAQDSAANRQMIEAAAQLAADSLEDLRDLGLLDVESFKALPLKSSTFEEEGTRFFKPVYDSIRAALRTKPLLPRRGGRYVAANQARLARGAKLAGVFSPSQLGILYASGSLYWLDTDITADRMPELHSYLAGKRQSWPPNQWEQEPIVSGMELDAKDLASKLTEQFLRKQGERWLRCFYAYLADAFEPFRDKPIIRLEDGSQVPSELAFLPPADASAIDIKLFPLVKRSLTADDATLKFFRDKAKLREPNPVDNVIKSLLPKYESGSLIFDAETYKRDLEAIVAACKDDSQNRLSQVLRNTKFIACTPAWCGESDKVTWKTPGDSNVFSRSRELKAWFLGNNLDGSLFLHPVAEQVLGDSIAGHQVAQRSLLADCDPTQHGNVCLKNSWGRNKRGLAGFDPRARIIGLDFALNHWTLDRARFLWPILLDIPHLIKGETQYATNINRLDAAPREMEFSAIGTACTKAAWLPDRRGMPHNPRELLLADLDPDLDTTSVRAKEVAERLGMKQPARLLAVQELAQGNPRREALLEKFLSANDAQLDQLEQLLAHGLSPEPPAPAHSVTQPEASTRDPAWRRRNVVENAEDAPSNESVQRERSVQVGISEVTAQAKAYLRAKYMNLDEQLVCQCCQQEMPFKLPSGDHYFEAVQCIQDKGVRHFQNRLALCPTCAAMYQYARETDDETVLSSIANHPADDQAPSIEIAVRLAGQDMTLRFVGTHWFDLKTVLAHGSD